jgi:hypothetical protein
LGAPENEPAPQQVQLQQWSWDFPLIGEVPGGKVMAIVIKRPPLGEVFVIPAAIADMKRFHAAMGAAIQKYDTGLIVPPAGFQIPRPPTNGAHS